MTDRSPLTARDDELHKSESTTGAPEPLAGITTFTVRSPGTGEVVGTHPMHTAVDVERAVHSARSAGSWWTELSFAERGRRLDAWRGVIASRSDELAELIRTEMGKPVPDAMLEITMALEHLAWAAKNAERVLGRRSTRLSLLTVNQKGSVEYRPLGVVGVIGPWNYPIFTPLGSLSFALAAGNTVVYKPSEYTPAVGLWLAKAFSEVVPEHPVLQVVTGDGTTGDALCRSGVNKVGFTGSTATGKKVMAACAASLTPVLMECGGKDALIIDSDCDLDAAADAAAWGAFANAGQTCLGVERVYVHEDVYDRFMSKLLAVARKVTAGSSQDDQVGPLTMPGQVEIVRAHIEDAQARGATAVLGGLDAIDGQFVQPTVLTDVPEDALAITEETFGPTLTVTRVRDMDDAISRANAGRYGLGASVFSRRNGVRIAERIRSGAVAVNAYVIYGAIPTLPLGGVDDSGFGRVHGPDGLREFAYTRAMTVQRLPSPLPLTSFRRGPRIDALVRTLVSFLHGKKQSS